MFIFKIIHIFNNHQKFIFMKKIHLLILGIILLFTTNIKAQLGNNYCSNYRNYNELRDDKNPSDLQTKEFYNPVIGYGDTREKAKYNAKIVALRTLLYNQMYLENPIIDSLMAQFAGEVLLINDDEVIVRKKHGQYFAKVFTVKYNKELIDYIKMYVDNFLKQQGAFTYNPYILINGDAGTKSVYDNATKVFATALLSSKYHLDGIKDTRMLELAKLPAKPANYCPCKGFQYYITGNKYLDYINALKNNANQQINLDILFSLDTISIIPIPGSSDKIIDYHILVFNAHNATIILEFDSKDTCSGLSDYECAANALNHVFERDADAIMFELLKRYSNYIRTAHEFSLLICDSLIDNNKTALLEGTLSSCKIFAQGSIRPGKWTNNGKAIGNTYNGRTYLLDPLALRSVVTRIVMDAGISDFEIYTSGNTYMVIPK